MATTLRVLIVEDSDDDAALLVRELRRGRYEPVFRQVCTADDLAHALRDEVWDIIVADWVLPDFNGLMAYELVRERGLDIPFLIVSGTISEEHAVEALKAGVNDFVTKGKLARLLPAIERELRETEVRRRQREAEAEVERQRQEVERSERLLRLILDSVPEGVIVVDEHGRSVLWNPAAKAVLRLSPTELKSDSWVRHYGLFLPDGRTPFPAEELAIAQALHGHSVDAQEAFLRNDAVPDGAWLNVTARPLLDARSSITGAVAILRDVTVEKATQEQLLISDRMASLGMVAAGVGHEINNPLAAVVGNIEVALGRLAGCLSQAMGPELTELREILADAQAAAAQMTPIVNDLRIFARQDNATDVQVVDIHRVLDSSARMAWNAIRHRARVVKEFGDVPDVKGSESRLGQVFLNLIVNAAQAFPNGNVDANVIRLATRLSADGFVVAEVTDTGNGLDEEARRRLFTPFFTTKPGRGGTGLGLVICERIVKSLGGRIDVRSELGRGATFAVCLPVANHSAGATAPIAKSRSPAARRGRILIVDDEPMIGALLRRILSDHEITFESTGQAALERIARGDRFDVILCDLLMPQMAGTEFYSRLLELRPQQASRLTFMTGGAFTPEVRQFLEQAKHEHLEKPFDVERLVALVNSRLE